MGLLDAIGTGLTEAAPVAARTAESYVQAQIDEAKQERLMEMKRKMTKDDAAEERARVAEYGKPIVGQKDAATGLIAESAGLNDASSVGADENVGVDVQKKSRAPLPRESQQRAIEAGDLVSAERFGKDADRQEDNARLDKRQISEDAKWHATEARQEKVWQETVRHNKALEANANYGRILPAAKAQLEMASTYVTSAHKAEAEAAKALEAGRKDTLASPEKIRQLETDYQSSKATVMAALKQYDQIGAAHFGEQWKKAAEVAPAPADNGALQKAHADAKAALATGRITREEVNKRLVAKGLAPLPDTDTPAAAKSESGLIGERSGANNPEANIYGTAEARERRRDELERIIGDNGYTRDERQAAERELAAMKK